MKQHTFAFIWFIKIISLIFKRVNIGILFIKMISLIFKRVYIGILFIKMISLIFKRVYTGILFMRCMFKELLGSCICPLEDRNYQI